MGKKKDLINTAIRLFSTQGYDGTTTLQISREAGVTEPLIYYHFKGKEELFTHILSEAFDTYYLRLQSLDHETGTEMSRIEALILLNQQLVEEMPRRLRLILSACPARIKDPEHICHSKMRRVFDWHYGFLTRCLKRGIETGEFVDLPVEETAAILICMLNGFSRRRSLYSKENIRDLRQAAIDFCRRSLLHPSR
ncbi:MAG: TetR/AcrR family transcriptional regulator [Desulfobacterales bacterium]|jgi:AcrR family transcriptional regulator